MLLTGEPYRHARLKTLRNKRWQLNTLRRGRRDWEAVLQQVLQAKGEKPELKSARTHVPA